MITTTECTLGDVVMNTQIHKDIWHWFIKPLRGLNYENNATSTASFIIGNMTQAKPVL